MLALSHVAESYVPHRGLEQAPQRIATMSSLGIDAQTYMLPAKQDIVCEGDRATFLYEIVEGTVAGYRILADGERHVVSFYFAGDLIGSCCGAVHQMSAHAITAVRLRRIPVAAIERMLDHEPQLARRLLRTAAEELTATRDHLVCIAAKSAEAKMASFLLAMSRRNAAIGEAANEIRLDMTRIDIGDYLGLTVETVSRTLTKMKVAGLIALPRATRVLLKNIPQLEATANS